MKIDFTIQRAALAHLPVFLAVAEAKSFTRAARALGISPSAASQAVVRLERELDAVLLVRTTRSVNLTDAGRLLAERARSGLELVSAALSAAGTKTETPTGRLRLNVPRIACRTTLPPLLARYAELHPHVQVEVTADDRNIDIISEGFDAGVRMREAVQKDMVAVRFSPPQRFVVAGSPAYFAKHGRPRHPGDLVNHACAAWRSPTSGELWRWEFEHRGRPLDVAVDGPLTGTDAELLVGCAREGLGLTYTPSDYVEADLASGRLETVLDPYCIEISGLFLYYPRAAARVPKLAAFVACAKAMLAKAPLTPA
jgi:DNA-binding transcriptional LysR family regulator